MPTISSRPQVIEDDTIIGGSLIPDDIAEMISDAIIFASPPTTNKLEMVLRGTCRTLWNVGIIEDFYISPAGGGRFDVGFKLENDPHYHVIKIN